MTGPTDLMYAERQSATDQPIVPVAGVFVVAVATLAGAGWVAGLIAVLFIGFMWAVRLDTEVTGEAIQLSLRPILTRRYAPGDIRGTSTVTYRPIVEWGGWGYRMRGKGRAFTMAGTEAVRIDLDDDRYVLVGSRHAEALLAAVDRMRGQPGSP